MGASERAVRAVVAVGEGVSEIVVTNAGRFRAYQHVGRMVRFTRPAFDGPKSRCTHRAANAALIYWYIYETQSKWLSGKRFLRAFHAPILLFQ